MDANFWVCKNCGVKVEAAYDICYNCLFDKDGNLSLKTSAEEKEIQSLTPYGSERFEFDGNYLRKAGNALVYAACSFVLFAIVIYFRFTSLASDIKESLRSLSVLENVPSSESKILADLIEIRNLSLLMVGLFLYFIFMAGYHLSKAVIKKTGN